MLVDNFSSVDQAIEVTRNDLDLTGTGDHYTGGWEGRSLGNVPHRKTRARGCRYDSDPSLKISAYRPRWFSLGRDIRERALRQLMVSAVNTCLSDNILAVEHAVDGESLLILILYRDGQEFSEACSPFEPSGRHAWVRRKCLCVVRR